MSHDSGEVDIYKQSDGISKSVAKKAAKAYGAKDISITIIPKMNCCFLVQGERCLRIMPPKKVSEFIISENDKSLHSNIASIEQLSLSFL